MQEMSNRICPNCSCKLPNGVKFCSNCGERIGGGNIVCLSCAHANQPDTKFCVECGARLYASQCPSCGHMLAAPARFCPECGERMGEEAPLPAIEADLGHSQASSAASLQEGELRTVTVLFADISGFTSMSEKLLPDEVHQIMDRIMVQLSDAITEHGGRIDKYIGDCIMAEFGLPKASENDPQRAVDAALAMQERIKELEEKTEKEYGIQPKMRIGINTGKVLAGFVGKGDDRSYTAMGDTVNLASRLESAAPVGSILISYNTYRHITGLYAVRALDPIRVKGKEHPVKVIEVLAKKEGSRLLPLRGLSDVEIRMIGRDVELQMLSGYFQQIQNNRYMEAVAVSGQAGVGKSRLVLEFQKTLEEKGQALVVFEAQCLPHAESDPFAPWRESLMAFFGVSSVSSPRDALENIISKLESLNIHDASFGWDIDHLANVLAYVLAIELDSSSLGGMKDGSSASTTRQKGFDALSMLFQRVARTQSIVLVVEDLHWAPEGFVDLLMYLLQNLEDNPIFLLITTRPETVESGQLQPIQSRLHLLHLQALPQAPARNLVSHILRKIKDLPEDLRNWIAEHGGGNPLLMEELVRHMLDQGHIAVEEDQWRFCGDSWDRMKIPPTISGIIERRIDSLTPEEKALCQRAAVAGDTFWVDLLESMGARNIENTMKLLEEKSILVREMTGTGLGEKEYCFKLPLAREVVYQNTLKKKRSKYHEQCAVWMEKHFKDRLQEYADRLAWHYDKCRMENKALEYYMLSARRAIAVYSNKQSKRYFRRCLALVLSIMEKEGKHAHLGTVFEVYQGIGFVKEHVGEYDKALTIYGEALELMDRHADHPLSFQWQAELLIMQATVLVQKGKYERALSALENGHRLLDRYREASGDQVQLHGKLHYWQGWALQQTGRYEEALKSYREGMESLGNDIRTKAGATILSGMAVTYQYLDDWDNALATSMKSLTIKESLGAHKQIATELINIGLINTKREDWKQAEMFLRRGLDISDKIGDVNKVAAAYCNLGELHVLTGDLDQAEKNLKLSLEKFESIGARYGCPEIYRQLATVARRQGEQEKGREMLEKSLHWARELNASGEEASTLEMIREWEREATR